MSIPITTSKFFTTHCYRVDLPNDEHVRFSDLICAARTALHHSTSVWDEHGQRGYSTEECRRMVAGADSHRGWREAC